MVGTFKKKKKKKMKMLRQKNDLISTNRCPSNVIYDSKTEGKITDQSTCLHQLLVSSWFLELKLCSRWSRKLLVGSKHPSTLKCEYMKHIQSRHAESRARTPITRHSCHCIFYLGHFISSFSIFFHIWLSSRQSEADL